MHHLRRCLLVVVALAIVFGLTGCMDQTTDANAAIDAANVQIKTYTESGAALEKLMAEAEALPMDQANAARGAELTNQMTTRLEEQAAAAKAAKAELSKISQLRVRAEFKSYAEKEIAVTDTLLEEDPVAKTLIQDLKKIYELVASGKATQADIDAVSKRIDTETKQLTELEDQAAKREQEASSYFEAQKLGGT